MPLAGFGTAAPLKDSAKEIAAADHPKIRLLLQQHRITDTPQADSDNTWKVCTSESAMKFSAAAYFFAREIQQKEGDIPVGVIDTSFGGTPAQSWISSEGIAWADLPSIAYEAGAVVRNTGRATGLRQQYAAEDAEARAAGKPVPTHPRLPGGGAEQSIPSTLYDGMVQPYVKYSIRGVIWYQGESDTSTPSLAANYSRVFPALITDWRKQWGEGEFPFIFVQIAGEDGAVTWGVVRDAQRRSLAVANTGMAVILDAAEAKNIHPADKQIVGARLGQIALGMVYGKKVETASPLFVQATTEDNAIRAWFSHADRLRASDKTIGDFEVAGEDHHFVPATAVIERIGTMETVIAHADAVPMPRYIRYGWTPYVNSYLYNAGGLPMSTFTSESDAQMVAR
jgi:sialate O-acetylesterase